MEVFVYLKEPHLSVNAIKVSLDKDARTKIHVNQILAKMVEDAQLKAV